MNEITKQWEMIVTQYLKDFKLCSVIYVLWKGGKIDYNLVNTKRYGQNTGIAHKNNFTIFNNDRIFL